MAIDVNNRTKMSRWLRPLIFPYDDKHPAATRLMVKHITANDKMLEVRSFPVRANMEDSDVGELITELEMAMVDDAEGIGGAQPQRYIIQAFDKGKKLVGRLTLRYLPTKDEEELANEIDDSEPATSGGLAKQLMRHLEAKERIQVAGYGNLITGQARIIEAQQRQLDGMTGKFMEMMTTIEELSSMKHQRELETQESEASIRMKEQLAQRAMMLFGPIAKKLGFNIPVESPDLNTMKEFLHSLDENQLQQMVSTLAPEQALALMSLMEKEAKGQLVPFKKPHQKG